MFIPSPMEQFQIYPIISFPLVLNNVIFSFIIAALITITLAIISGRGGLVGTWWGILNESLYRTILSMVENYIGKNATIYFPLIFTVYHVILFSNLLGMIPYTTTPTVEIVMTLSLSYTLLFGTILIGFLTHRLFLFTAFLPAGTPIVLVPFMMILESLAYLIKILSLGLRLAINLTTGHVLVKTLVGFIWSAYLEGTNILLLTLPLFLLTLFLALEILICYLQAYIFTFITCLTIKDMANLLINDTIKIQ